MAGRRLSADEAALWARVMATVTPLPPGGKIADADHDDPPPPGGGGTRQRDGGGGRRLPAVSRPPLPSPSAPPPPGGGGSGAKPGTTLDGSWDRNLARGTVDPDATVDLHGHTLTSAHAMLDQALDRSRARGDRVILLITGKPPRRDSERPHARGAIRAAVGDWLHGSRHAGAIAAVRGASPRHGGSGALYIVLRRARTTPNS